MPLSTVPRHSFSADVDGSAIAAELTFRKQYTRDVVQDVLTAALAVKATAVNTYSLLIAPGSVELPNLRNRSHVRLDLVADSPEDTWLRAMYREARPREAQVTFTGELRTVRIDNIDQTIWTLWVIITYPPVQPVPA